MILRLLASRRCPDKYLAGATVIHRTQDSPRYSRDLDYFHDLTESIAQSAESDAKTLEDSGFSVKWILRNPTFYRAIIELKNESLTLDWAQDSAFRFFPLQQDEECGYRLHDADAAINKLLAMAGRNEARDYVDILYIDRTYLGLGALAWAACGKDPGYTPEFILEHMARHAAYTQADIDRLDLAEHMDIVELKKRWLTALRNAHALIGELPAKEMGCLYLNKDGTPVNPKPETESFTDLNRHYGCISGAWPRPVSG